MFNKLIYKYINDKLNYNNIFVKKINNILNNKKINNNELKFFKKLIYKICLENANNKISANDAFSNSLWTTAEFYENISKDLEISDYIIFYNKVLNEFSNYIFYLRIMQKITK